jgi:hypothetical protein
MLGHGDLQSMGRLLHELFRRLAAIAAAAAAARMSRRAALPQIHRIVRVAAD